MCVFTFFVLHTYSNIFGIHRRIRKSFVLTADIYASLATSKFLEVSDLCALNRVARANNQHLESIWDCIVRDATLRERVCRENSPICSDLAEDF